jgi:uracil-DNA glycosylase
MSVDFGFPMPPLGNLTRWAEQGVLLLNTVLTVRENEPNSHRNKGWEKITDEAIRALNERRSPIVFLLWGRNAREKKALITNAAHLVLEAAHPSPLSANRGFFGCGHFIKANEFLVKNGLNPIDWRV